jgi:predicted RNase H-like HicB family nuclease
MSTHSYLIIVHPAGGGFWTEVPALPGCGSQGETVEEAVEVTTDAINGYWNRSGSMVRHSLKSALLQSL